MKLLLARHGETDWNAAGRIQGQTDTSLNAAGRAQAAELARRLTEAGVRVDRLYASPQKRAMETAEIVARTMGCSVTPVEALREMSFGRWEGCSWEEIERRWPETYRAYLRDRLTVPPPEGESFSALLGRVIPALETVAAGGGETGLVVSHSAVIKAVMCRLDNIPFEEIHLRCHLGNAQWAVVEAENGRLTRFAGQSDGEDPADA